MKKEQGIWLAQLAWLTVYPCILCLLFIIRVDGKPPMQLGRPDILADEFEKAVNLFQENKFEEAQKLLLKVATHNRKFKDVFFVLGAVFAATGKIDLAEANYRQAGDKHSSAVQHLSMLLRRRQRFDEALYEARNAVKLDPKDFQAHTALALALREMNGTTAFGEPEGWVSSLNSFQQAASLEPSEQTTRLNFGMALESVGRYSDAWRELSAAARLGPQDVDTLYHASVAGYNIGREEQAIEKLRKAVALQPKQGKCNHLLGVLLMGAPKANKKKGEAEKYLWQAVRASDRNTSTADSGASATAVLSLGQSLSSRGRADKVIALMRDRTLALSKQPSGKSQIAEQAKVSVAEAAAWLQLGMPQRAKSVLQKLFKSASLETLSDSDLDRLATAWTITTGPLGGAANRCQLSSMVPAGIAPRAILVPQGWDRVKVALETGERWVLLPCHASQTEDGKLLTESDIKNTPENTAVAVKYVEDPLLYQGRKLDILVYVLSLGGGPNAQIWLAKDGVAMIGDEAYDAWSPNLGGEKPKAYPLKPLIAGGFDVLWDEVKDATKRAFGQMHKQQSWGNGPALKIYGADFAAESSGRVWLLQVRDTPQLASSATRPFMRTVVRALQAATNRDNFRADVAPILKDHFDLL